MDSQVLARWIRFLKRLEKLTWAFNILLMAGLLTLGYTVGAFTNSSQHPTLMTTGTVKIDVKGSETAKTDAGIINFTNTQPGQNQENTITVVNDGSLPFTYTVRAETTAGDKDAELFDAIQVAVSTGDQVFYNGPLSGLATTHPLSTLQPKGESQVHFRVWLPADADNSLMGLSGTATFYFDAMQTGLASNTQ
ncbi:MAG: hypothetical protein ACYC5Y_00975 [Symbiobacteriia bacterium]